MIHKNIHTSTQTTHTWTETQTWLTVGLCAAGCEPTRRPSHLWLHGHPLATDSQLRLRSQSTPSESLHGCCNGPSWFKLNSQKASKCPHTEAEILLAMSNDNNINCI